MQLSLTINGQTHEARLIGQPLEAAPIKAAAVQVDADASDAMEDIRASGEYRRHLARMYARRALQAAFG